MYKHAKICKKKEKDDIGKLKLEIEKLKEKIQNFEQNLHLHKINNLQNAHIL